MEKKILNDNESVLTSVDTNDISKFCKEISASNYILFNPKIIIGSLGDIQKGSIELYYLELKSGTKLSFPLKANGDWILFDTEYLESLSNDNLVRISQEIDNFKNDDYNRRKYRRNLANKNKFFGERHFSEKEWELIIQEEIKQEWSFLESISDFIKKKTEG